MPAAFGTRIWVRSCSRQPSRVFFAVRRSPRICWPSRPASRRSTTPCPAQPMLWVAREHGRLRPTVCLSSMFSKEPNIESDISSPFFLQPRRGSLSPLLMRDSRDIHGMHFGRWQEKSDCGRGETRGLSELGASLKKRFSDRIAAFRREIADRATPHRARPCGEVHAWLPRSTISPSFTTKIRSADWIVGSLCAITIEVLPSIRRSRASNTSFSDAESSPRWLHPGSGSEYSGSPPVRSRSAAAGRPKASCRAPR